MKFKKLNESSIADYLAKRFKEYEIYTDDGDRYWHFVDQLKVMLIKLKTFLIL